MSINLIPGGFTLGHYPQSFDYSSLGGWVAMRPSGQQSRHYGRIEQLFAGGDVLTPRGSLNLPPFPASAAGPDLRQILLGSEGRMGVLTNVVVKIAALPEKDDVYGVFFPSWERAVHAAQTVRRLALDSLKAAKSFLPPGKRVDRKSPVFNEWQQTPAQDCGLAPETWRRLYGRYDNAADSIVKTAKAGDLSTIAGTHTLWLN